MAHQTITWMSAFLCLAQVVSMPMPCQLQRHLVGTTYNLLRDMGGHFPLECLQENVFMAFPATAFASSREPHFSSSAAKAIYETLKNIDTLFGTDELPTMWDQQKLEYFQNIIYRQIEETECMMGRVDTRDYLIRSKMLNTYFRNIADVLKEKMSSVDTSDYPIRAEGLKTYFVNIAAVLKENNFTYCTWEVVRKELLYTLEFILIHHSDSLLWSNRT
uniref:interferon alpha-H-like n=1 Tax=Oncorhynchus gorbuscha TaxID=8017 RepID=UPI001EAEAB0B|nr:interferon alpha-H-like [Oncorhynchus gorbuscha]